MPLTMQSQVVLEDAVTLAYMGNKGSIGGFAFTSKPHREAIRELATEMMRENPYKEDSMCRKFYNNYPKGELPDFKTWLDNHCNEDTHNLMNDAASFQDNPTTS